MLEKEMAKRTLAARGKAFYEKQLKTLLEPQREGGFGRLSRIRGVIFWSARAWRRWTRRGRRGWRSCFI